MLNSKIRSRRSLRNQTTSIVRLGSEIQSHPAWQGDVSLTEGAKLLEGSAPFTYILSQGFDKHHYFLSFVDADYKVKHRNVRVFARDGHSMYLNGGSGGGGGGYETIDNLVPSCINCSADVCRPL